jgi:hypothetical protein
LFSLFCFEGGTRHLAFLLQDPELTRNLLKKNYISQSLAILSLGLGKIAIALLILRLLDRVSPWRRWSLHFANGITLINTVLMILFTFIQCENPAALWDNDIKATTKCWDPSVQSSFSIYGAAMHALVDFYLAILPATLSWRYALCLVVEPSPASARRSKPVNSASSMPDRTSHGKPFPSFYGRGKHM